MDTLRYHTCLADTHPSVLDDFPMVFPANLHFEMMIQPQFEIPWFPHGSPMVPPWPVQATNWHRQRAVKSATRSLGHPGPTTYGGGLVGIFIQKRGFIVDLNVSKLI